LLLAIIVAAQVAKLVPRPRFAVVGVVLAFTAFVLFRVTPAGAIDLSIALVFGIGVGFIVAVARGRRAPEVQRGPRRSVGRRPVAVAVAGSLLAGGLVLWVGANDPTVQWFGHVVTHGDRTDRRVALTFDDGPDDPFSLEVSAILDRHGVKGTFFEVGKAVDARPEIARALYADGHLLGNHSYHHDYWRWLDPRYPELARTQDAFERQLGVCPAFFRPPHGQRTPFMLAHASDRSMVTVTWDVSAGDWSADDGEAVARKVLDHVEPGSIILLHDGIDGTVTADRSVLIAALPIILDGLKAKGLEPVRLDELLGRPGYLDHC
jgi:peptidoglycan/xylan/chitin deacetylase (PgdA/CDA1 family)